MINRKNLRRTLSYISFFILLSCSKSDQLHYVVNSFTYTFTDTTGVSHTFSNAAYYIMEYHDYYAHVSDPEKHPTGPVASITHDPWGIIQQPSSFKLFEFGYNHYDNGYDTSIYLNFSLPYFQASLSGPNNLNTYFELNWTEYLKVVRYSSVSPSPNGQPGTVYLANFTTSTNISDSTNDVLSGSFDISATTLDSGKIHISGKFSLAPTNYTP